jgi:small subunit ribosomal protein S4
MLKGTRCDTAKCPMERQWRSQPPGMQAMRRGRRKSSAYGIRLREKQKVKRYYGVWEKQFMLYFRQAERAREKTGTVLLRLLERRLDNVVYSLQLAPSRPSARVTIVHGHICVNGRKVDRPSYQVREGDVISVKSSEKSRKFIRERIGSESLAPQPPWLELDVERLEGKVTAMPTRDDIKIPVEEQLIVEMCSR